MQQMITSCDECGNDMTTLTPAMVRTTAFNIIRRSPDGLHNVIKSIGQKDFCCKVCLIAHFGKLLTELEEP